LRHGHEPPGAMHGGEFPNRLMKARRMRSWSPKPTEDAIDTIGSRPVSTRALAASARNHSITVAGVSPVASWKAGANCRGLREAMLASRSTVKSSAKCACANMSVLQRDRTVGPAKASRNIGIGAGMAPQGFERLLAPIPRHSPLRSAPTPSLCQP